MRYRHRPRLSACVSAQIGKMHKSHCRRYRREAFGRKHGLETKTDEVGNVLIKKPATPGKENLKTVILQSHIDMVCEKNSDVEHDFLIDPIDTVVDGEWLKAKVRG